MGYSIKSFGGRTVTYDIPGAAPARITLKLPTPWEAQRIRASVKRKVAVPLPDGGFEFVNDYDDGSFTEAMLKFMVVGWEGIDLPPNAPEDRGEQVLLLMSDPVLQDFVLAKMEEAMGTAEEEEAKGGKNSKTSPGGSQNDAE